MKSKNKKAGGLCHFLAKKYKWSKDKENKCIKKAIRGRKSKRRR
jgi:hypothetical protein